MGGEDEGRLVFRSSAATVEGGGTGKESVFTGGREPGRPELSEGSKRDELVKSVRTLREHTRCRIRAGACMFHWRMGRVLAKDPKAKCKTAVPKPRGKQSQAKIFTCDPAPSPPP